MLMKGKSLAWIAGTNVMINELMINYHGRDTAFVPYLPKKPIKHLIKVFAVCCYFNAILLGFEISVGNEPMDDNKALELVKRLIKDVDLTAVWGRKLYTDNWCTSIFMTTLFLNMVGDFVVQCHCQIKLLQWQ